MVRRLLRAILRPRRSVVHLAVIAVLPLAGLAYWQVSRGGNGGEGSRSLVNENPAPESFAQQQTIKTDAGATSHTDPLPIKNQKHPSPDSLRNTALTRLHSEAIRQFVRAPGNGVGRIGAISQIGQIGQIGQPKQVNQIGQIGQISQIGSIGRIGVVYQQMPTLPKLIVQNWTLPMWSPGELSDEKWVVEDADLNLIHKQSLMDFSNDISLSSSSSPISPAVPQKTKTWEAKNIELVGLLMHDPPVVYVSEKLQMSNLKEVPTRSLDFFEIAGLDKLQNGKELYARSQNETIRLLGAVRAQKQCLSCHDVAEGKLLGAFSYTLRVAQYR